MPTHTSRPAALKLAGVPSWRVTSRTDARFQTPHLAASMRLTDELLNEQIAQRWAAGKLGFCQGQADLRSAAHDGLSLTGTWRAPRLHLGIAAHYATVWLSLSLANGQLQHWAGYGPAATQEQHSFDSLVITAQVPVAIETLASLDQAGTDRVRQVATRYYTPVVRACQLDLAAAHLSFSHRERSTLDGKPMPGELRQSIQYLLQGYLNALPATAGVLMYLVDDRPGGATEVGVGPNGVLHVSIPSMGRTRGQAALADDQPAGTSHLALSRVALVSGLVEDSVLPALREALGMKAHFQHLGDGRTWQLGETLELPKVQYGPIEAHLAHEAYARLSLSAPGGRLQIQASGWLRQRRNVAVSGSDLGHLLGQVSWMLTLTIAPTPSGAISGSCQVMRPTLEIQQHLAPNARANAAQALAETRAALAQAAERIEALGPTLDARITSIAAAIDGLRNHVVFADGAQLAARSIGLSAANDLVAALRLAPAPTPAEPVRVTLDSIVLPGLSAETALTIRCTVRTGSGQAQSDHQLAVTTGTPININRASPAQLEPLPAIGTVLAQRIVDYRNAHGPFTRISQLLDVDGISERRFGQIERLITTADSGASVDAISVIGAVIFEGRAGNTLELDIEARAGDTALGHFQVQLQAEDWHNLVGRYVSRGASFTATWQVAPASEGGEV